MGLGVGSVGLAGRAAAEGEFWFAPEFGVGFQAVALGQVSLGSSTSAVLLGPTFVARSRTWRGEWLFICGLGFAGMTRSYYQYCPFGCVEPTTTRSADGIYSSVGIGHVQLARHRVLGLGLKLDVLGRVDGQRPEPQAIGTLNFLIGVDSR